MKRWFAMAAQYTKDAKIEELGEELGPGGPLALVVLMGQAKMQANGGRVEGTFRDLAHDAFIDRPDAQRTIERAAEVGVIEVESTDERGFVAQFPHWRRYQEAFRKQLGREGAQDGAESPAPSAGSPQSEAPTGTRTGTGTQTTTEEPSLVPSLPPELSTLGDNLNRVVEGKRAKPVKPRLVLKACSDFHDRDLELEADKFAHYWLDGGGENRRMRDVVGAFRRWLGNAPSAAKARGNGRHAVDSDIARLEAEKQRLRAEEAA